MIAGDNKESADPLQKDRRSVLKLELINS